MEMNLKEALIRARKAIRKLDMNPKCDQFIRDYVKKNNIKRVLEFGSGGSTKMFEQLECSVITVEHDPAFYH